MQLAPSGRLFVACGPRHGVTPDKRPPTPPPPTLPPPTHTATAALAADVSSRHGAAAAKAALDASIASRRQGRLSFLRGASHAALRAGGSVRGGSMHGWAPGAAEPRESLHELHAACASTI